MINMMMLIIIIIYIYTGSVSNITTDLQDTSNTDYDWKAIIIIIISLF